jgi:hypothetical protein
MTSRMTIVKYEIPCRLLYLVGSLNICQLYRGVFNFVLQIPDSAEYPYSSAFDEIFGY